MMNTPSLDLSSPTAYVAAGIAIVTLVTLKYVFTRKSRPPKPPGPKGLPLIGNVHQIPAEKEWLKYSEWADKYGDVISLTALGTTIVILGTPDAANDLLDKRGQIYSGRPEPVMLGELMGWNNTLGLNSLGETFREYRRLIHKFMGTKALVQEYTDVQEREAKNFLRLVLRDPKNLPEHIRRTAGAIIVMMTYGYQIEENDDPFVTTVNRANATFELAWRPGSFLVDTFPWLKMVPDWFPGTEWKRKAAAWRKTLFEMADLPYNFSKTALENGTAVKCFTANLLNGKQNITPQEEHAIKWSAASLYGGGADTTVSAVYSFILAMTLYPEVQKRGQEEIDRVVGPDRLPTFADRPNLPYVEAIMQEVLRWNPVLPLSVPHRATADDVYNGHFIPNGAIVMVNAWRLTHDPRTFPKPDVFSPERFLGSTPQRDPRGLVFGHGRRACPGLHLADATVFIEIAMLLAVFQVNKAVVDGKEVEPVVDYSSGGISHPTPFECSVVPRSKRAEALIHASAL